MREFKAGFVLSFAIVAVAFSIDFRISNRFEENINRNYLEADMLQVEAKENSFNEESIDTLKEEYGIVEAVLVTKNTTRLVSAGNIIAKTDVKLVNINEYFKKRIMENDIKGSFLENENQIILAKETAKCLGDIKSGDTISMYDENRNKKQYTVVGINESLNSNGINYSIISEKMDDANILELYTADTRNTFSTLEAINSNGKYFGSVTNSSEKNAIFMRQDCLKGLTYLAAVVLPVIAFLMLQKQSLKEIITAYEVAFVLSMAGAKAFIWLIKKLVALPLLNYEIPIKILIHTNGILFIAITFLIAIKNIPSLNYFKKK